MDEINVIFEIFEKELIQSCYSSQIPWEEGSLEEIKNLVMLRCADQFDKILLENAPNEQAKKDVMYRLGRMNVVIPTRF